MKKVARSLAVFSTKGGVGKTILTLSLAGVASINKKILLIDGSVNNSLSVLIKHKNKTILEASNDIKNNLFTSYKEYVYSYNKNIDILSSSNDYLTKIDNIEDIIDTFKYYYDLILIDTSSIINEYTIRLLDYVDEVLFVIDNDIFTLNSTKDLINIFNKNNKLNYKVLLNASIDHKVPYFLIKDIKNIIDTNVDYTISKDMFFKDISSLLYNYKIPILSSSFYKNNDKDIKVLNLIIKDLDSQINKKSILSEFNIDLKREKKLNIDECFDKIIPFINDDNISEIMVYLNRVYIKINDKFEIDNRVKYISNEETFNIIDKLLKYYNKSRKGSIINTRLNDNYILESILPPVSLRGPLFILKKTKKSVDTIDDYIRKGILTPYMARFLEACVKGRLNVLILGNNNVVKLNLLNILSGFIDSNSSVVSIDNNISKDNFINLERNEYDLSNIIKVVSSINPDVILVNEITHDEILKINELNNTSLIGSFTSNSVCNYDNIDLIVRIDKINNDRVKVLSISEIDKENNKIKDIFVYRVNTNEFVRYNFYPNILKILKNRGIEDIDYIFSDK